jgi:hypothetical protein
MKNRREDAARHRYRVTVEHVHTPHAGDPLDPPLVFETSNQDALMLLFIVNRLRGGACEMREEESAIVIDQTQPQRWSTRPM